MKYKFSKNYVAYAQQAPREGGKEVNNLYKQKAHKKIIMLKYCKLTAG